jgi:hypothetical protein
MSVCQSTLEQGKMLKAEIQRMCRSNAWGFKKALYTRGWEVFGREDMTHDTGIYVCYGSSGSGSRHELLNQKGRDPNGPQLDIFISHTSRQEFRGRELSNESSRQV